MPAPTNKPHQSHEIVLPDCCNLGVISRVLVAINLAAILMIMLRGSSFDAGLLDFASTATVSAPVSLLSLLTLCALRRVAVQMQPNIQRLLCALVPALYAALVLRLLERLGLASNGATHLSALAGLCVAALHGIVLQHYFELRLRAYSPALDEARLQALQARIRPHFLFNSLNAVLSLIRNEPRRAETALEDLADLFRELLRDGRQLTSLDDELRLCRQYLSIEKIRLGDRLQIEWDASAIHADVLQQARIPSLLLQPLLENAVYHGIEQSAGTGQIRISLRRARDMIHIAILNPYHAVSTVSTGNHMALTNIRSRLALLYDVEASLTTAIIAGHFEVRMAIPYVKGDA